MELWEVKLNGERKAYGSEKTSPSSEERKILRESGHQIFADGKEYNK